MGLTSEQFRRRFELEKGAMEALLSDVLGWPRAKIRDSNRPLSAYEIEALSSALPAPVEPELTPPPAPAPPPPALIFGQDAPHPQGPRRQARYTLYAHEDFLEEADATGRAHLKRRVALVLHQLAAHGRTSVNKPTHGENLGWLRAPLGGNGGSHFYLWWTRQGTPILKGHALDRPRAIVLRAVRHHDDHRPLRVEGEESYLHLDVPDLEEAAFVPAPWEQPQRAFIDAHEPVRVLAGYPGSGKTTALWKAVDARRGEDVLYVTWSQSLTLRAEEHFETFAAPDTHVEALAFTDLLGRLLGEDIVRPPLAACRAAFAEALKRLNPERLGPWRGRADALFAELRGGLIGAAQPTRPFELAQPNTPRLKDTIYRSQRAKLGEALVEATLVLAALLEAEGPLIRFFPELEAAWRAAEGLLATRPLPAGLLCDRMVVDEVQDLTRLEVTVLTELARRVAADRHRAPFLLFAGDEGQTVRPSHFHWGPFNRLLDERLAPPRKFTLKGNLRSPKAIAEVIDRAGELYDFLPKDKRPRHRIPPDTRFAASAQLFYVRAHPSMARDFVAAFDEIGGAALLRLDEAPLPWLEGVGEGALLLPEEAKGLEHQIVCVLEPGAHLTRLAAMSPTPVEMAIKREAIDRLRVAVSRATETLIFLDVSPSAEAQAASLALLGQPVEYDWRDLIEHLKSGHVSPEARVTGYIKDALQLQEERPLQAWRRARQAVRLLGDPELPNGVADEALRAEAREVAVQVAWSLYCGGAVAGLDLDGLRAESLAAARALDREDWAVALERLGAEYGPRDIERLLPLLDALLKIERPPWMRHALRRRAQGWRRRLYRASEDPRYAPAFRGYIEGWLEILDVPAAALMDEAHTLRKAALGCLLREGADLKAARAIHEQLRRPEPRLTAALEEAQGLFAQAAARFERLGDAASALRCWRAAGDLDKTLQHRHAAAPAVEVALDWMARLRDVLDERPADLHKTLTAAERRWLKAQLERSSSDHGA
ncbi:hypothetical protein KKF91_17425 [Myxococcota bacterium]|nr:hypothetical protein [Myxococcota bacterium]MBU1432322.1 hypothetical protein [Myxococcota bacterium]MBU1897042.1 hypothetical protein [Myxococcota bacterium]